MLESVGKVIEVLPWRKMTDGFWEQIGRLCYVHTRFHHTCVTDADTTGVER